MDETQLESSTTQHDQQYKLLWEELDRELAALAEKRATSAFSDQDTSLRAARRWYLQLDLLYWLVRDTCDQSVAQKIVQQDISRIRLINAKRGQRGSTVVGDRDSECGEQQLPLLGIDADRLKPEAEVMKVDVRESSAGGENLGGGENQSSPQPPMPAGVKADIPEICRKIDAMYEKVLPAIKLYEGGRLLTAQQDRGRPGRHLEEELDRQILRTTREMMGYVKDLAEEVLVMVEYTRTVVLEKYTVEAATRLVEYFGALIRSMSLKLQILLLTMRVRLYTPELTSSLANLRASLELEERDLNAQLSRVREQLTMYRDAGDEFVQLAGVYRDVMQEIDRVRRDIDSISELRD